MALVLAANATFASNSEEKEKKSQPKKAPTATFCCSQTYAPSGTVNGFEIIGRGYVCKTAATMALAQQGTCLEAYCEAKDNYFTLVKAASKVITTNFN